MGKKKRKIQSKKVYLIETIIIIVLIVIGTYYNRIDVKSLQEKLKETDLENSELNTTEINNQTETNKNDNQEVLTSNKIEFEEELLNVFYFDVGQADSTLIISNNKTMLIDAGNNNDAKYIVNCLKDMGIENLDYFIGTHIHEDNLGGADNVINELEVDKIYLPTNKSCTDKYYESVLEAISNTNKKISKPKKGDLLQLGSSSVEIMAVDNTEPEERNNASIVLELTYENQKFLFMGDSEKAVENSREWNDVDVLKVGHHGSLTSSQEKFLNQVKPETSIISVGEDNQYGLPKQEILERLGNINSKIYRTDTDGTIQVASDGNSNSITKIDISLDGN